MKTTIRVIFASAFALSAIGPALADEGAMSKHEMSMSNTTNMSPANHHASAQRMRAQQAFEAKAYAPAGSESVDFSIGSQR